MSDHAPRDAGAVRRIDPTVDCVFQTLLGSEANLNLLRHFLSSMVPFPDPIEELTLLNPYNPKQFQEDKYGIVDVKARDGLKRVYQIEIQTTRRAGLPSRMVYHQAKIVAMGLQEGADYDRLPPVISIWLLTDNLFPRRRTRRALLRFRWTDAESGLMLDPRHTIQVVQLKNLGEDDRMEGDRALWLRFFSEGKNFDLDHPPAWIHTSPEMEQAMSVMQQFSKDFEQMMLYDSREKARRDSLEFQKEVAARNQREARAEIQRLRARQEAEAARADANAALADAATAQASANAALADAATAQASANAARADAAEAKLARRDDELARRDDELARRDAELAALRRQLGLDA